MLDVLLEWQEKARVLERSGRHFLVNQIDVSSCGATCLAVDMKREINTPQGPGGPKSCPQAPEDPGGRKNHAQGPQGSF